MNKIYLKISSENLSGFDKNTHHALIFRNHIIKVWAMQATYSYTQASWINWPQKFIRKFWKVVSPLNHKKLLFDEKAPVINGRESENSYTRYLQSLVSFFVKKKKHEIYLVDHGSIELCSFLYRDDVLHTTLEVVSFLFCVKKYVKSL